MSTLEQPEPDDGPESTAPNPEAPEPAPDRDAPGTLDVRPDGETAAAEPEQGDAARSEAGGDRPPAEGEPGSNGSTLERPSVDDPFEAQEIAVQPASVRHAPRFGRFALVGGLLGIVAAFLLAPFARYENLNVPWHFDPWGLALVLAAMLLPLGILLGCVVALVSDRRSRKKVVR